ncbi:MAG TPA: hypothetical protein VFO66_07955 [Gemmatimonadaceae bacterium]|nr:hypothetical protein [Gemmatimonadaceae bacterium]
MTTAAVALAPAPLPERPSPQTLEVLRALLPAPQPQSPGMPTGLDALDAALASNGLPRGRLTEVVGATGKLTLLREIVRAAVERGEWVAYIDATRTLSPRDWAAFGDDGLCVIRPPDAGRAAWCADVLLRSAAFALVVLDSAPPISRAVSVRLTGLARESNAALVTVGTGSPTKLGGAVRLHVSRRRQRLKIAIEKGQRAAPGGARNSRLQSVVEVRCDIGVARRLCSHPEIPDRRGVSREKGGGRGKRDGRRAATPRVGRGMLQHC